MISSKIFSIFLLFIILVSSITPMLPQSNAQMFNFFGDTQKSDSMLIQRTADANIYYNPTTHQSSWQSAPTWIYDNATDQNGNPVYKPYRLFDYPTYTQLETAQGSLIFDKVTCSGRIYPAGWINSSSIGSSDSYIFRYAVNGTNMWTSPSSVNGASCQPYITQSGDNIEIGGIRHVNGMGDFKVRYIKNNGQGIESTVDITNWNSSMTNYKFATTQTINLPSQFVTIGNTTFNLANYNGTFLSHTWIATHRGALLKIFGKMNLDLSGSFKHVWGITILYRDNRASLAIDYAMNSPVLQSGQTLEIDPTFNQYGSPNNYVYAYTGSNTFCPSSSPSPSSLTNVNSVTGSLTSFDDTAGTSGCDLSAARWSLSSFPTTAIVTSVQLNGSYAGIGGPASIRNQTKDDPNGATLNTMWADIHGATGYAASPSTNGIITKVNLGGSAVIDFNKQLSKGWFAIGWSALTTGGYSVQGPSLVVNYSMPVPNKVITSSCNSNSPMTNTCIWNTPTIPTNGSDTLGYYVNRNGANPPLYSSNLVGYWKMDGLNSKNQVPDYSTSGNNATLQAGSYTFLRGMIGGAQNFTGTEYLTASGSSLPVATSDRTLSLWVKTPHTFTGGNTLIFWGTESNNDAFGLDWGNTGSTSTICAIGWSNDRCSSTVLAINTWYQVVVTLSNTGQTRNMYINSVLDSNFPYTTTTLNTSFSNLLIGNRADLGAYGTGAIDDLRIYNRILTQAEITNLYNYRLVNNPLISQYSFENSLRDSVGGDNGTATGSISYTTGKFGQALVLGGSSYVTPANKNDFDFGRQNAFSLSGWFKTTNLSAQSIISKDAWNNQGYLIYEDGIVHFRIKDTTPTNYEIASSSGFSDNAWHFFAATYDGSGNKNGMKLYMDGSLVSTGTSATIANSISTTIPFQIGTASSGNGNFVGNLDEIHIFQNYVLTQQDVTNLYNSNLFSFTSSYTDNYLLSDGKTYSYQVYPVNLYGQNNTSTTVNSITKNYAPPPSTSGKFYKDSSNIYRVQFNWSKPPQVNQDPYTATGYQILNCNTLPCTILANNQTSPLSFTFSNLAQQTFQKLQVKSWSHFGLSPGYSFVKSNATSLVSHWPMDNSTIDIGPQVTSLTVSGNENYTVGHNGYALNLDGISYAYPGSQVSSLYSYDITNPFTISSWIKTTQTGHFQPIISKDNNGTDNGWYAEQKGNNADFVIRAGSTSYEITGSKTINNGDWQYLTFVYTGNSNKNGMTIYVNGTVDTTGSNTSMSGSAINSDLMGMGAFFNGLTGNSGGYPWLGQIDDPRIYSSALNSTQVSELWNEQITTRTNNNINQITGTHVLSHNTVGNMDRETSQLTITGGFPSPTITNYHLYNNTNIVNNTGVSIVINSGQTNNFLYGNWFNVTHYTNFKGVAIVSNGTATEEINSTVYAVSPNYVPKYQTATNGERYNYTVSRTNGNTVVTLNSNVVPTLFNMSCQILTSSQVGGSGGWYNQTKLGFYQQAVTVHNYDNVYGTCYDPDPAQLFTFVSYGNSSFFPAINFMNTSYSQFVGVPVGVIFVVMMGALGNRRTSPMWAVILLAMAGILATAGFFTLTNGIWALMIIAGLLALFVGRKYI